MKKWISELPVIVLLIVAVAVVLTLAYLIIDIEINDKWCKDRGYPFGSTVVYGERVCVGYEDGETFFVPQWEIEQ